VHEHSSFDSYVHVMNLLYCTGYSLVLNMSNTKLNEIICISIEFSCRYHIFMNVIHPVCLDKMVMIGTATYCGLLVEA
jgi:hypothetical protein